MKRVLSGLLCLVILCAVVPMSALTAYADEYAGFCGANYRDVTWTYNTDSRWLTITGSGDMADYGTYGNMQPPWKNYNIQRVVISDGVTSIGEYAFYNQNGNYNTITAVNISNTVTSIGYGAFYNCQSLSSISFPDSITSIGANAFYNTYWYDSQPDGLIYINKIAYHMKGLCPSSVSINNGTLVIANSAFSGNSRLERISFPDSVTSIGANAFNGTGLSSINLPNSVMSIGVGAFEYCSSLSRVTLSESITSIADYTFSYCTNISQMIIPNSVSSIGKNAFYNCNKLKWIDVKNSNCSFGSDSVPATTHIHCDEGTNAETYAKTNGNTYGHLWGNWIGSAPTCTEAENRKHTCSICGEIEERISPALGHNYGSSPVWTWSGDNTSATATFTCITSGCGHEETVNADITNIVENGKIKRTATAEIDGTTYTDTIIIDSPLDAAFDSAIMAGDVAAVDGNRFNLPTNLEYKKASLLGVQKKEAIQTTSGGTGLRFIAELSSEYVGKDNIDYGFEVVKTSRESTKAFDENGGFNTMQQLIDSGSDNIMSVSCKDTQNNVANPEYGDNDSDSTAYKYVTLSIKNIAYSQGVAVRFYVEIDGVRNYSSYQNSDGTFIGCCTSYNTIANLDA